MQNVQTTSASAPVLVLAASGKTGRRVADRLEARGQAVRRASRSSAIRFDWDDRSTYAPALAGVRAAYIVYTPDLAVPAAAAAVEAFVVAAREAGVEHLVILSGRGEEEAQRCEGIVRDSGVAWTVVRASWFTQNFSEGPFRDLVMSGAVALPASDVREPFVDVDDIADVVVEALVGGERHRGQVYEVTGPRALTFAEATAELAEATERPLAFVPITMDQFRAGLAEGGLPDEYRWLLEYLFTEVLDGRNEATCDGVQRALGREPRSFGASVRAAHGAGAWEAEEQHA